MTTSPAKPELTISAAEANRGFSRMLREVREGASYVVTSHGRPVAKVTPVTPEPDRLAARKALIEHLRHVQSQPTQNIGSWAREELYERGE